MVQYGDDHGWVQVVEWWDGEGGMAGGGGGRAQQQGGELPILTTADC